MMHNLDKKIINLLFVNGEEMSFADISKILEVGEEELKSEISKIKANLEYVGLTLLESNKSLSLVTSPDYSFVAQSLKKFDLSSELTPAQLQTLTIVSYMGPVTSANVSYIRGVQSTQTLRALSTRGLIKKESGEYVLTGDSLKYLGVSKIEDIPMYTETRMKLESKIKESLNG